MKLNLKKSSTVGPGLLDRQQSKTERRKRRKGRPKRLRTSIMDEDCEVEEPEMTGRISARDTQGRVFFINEASKKKLKLKLSRSIESFKGHKSTRSRTGRKAMIKRDSNEPTAVDQKGSKTTRFFFQGSSDQNSYLSTEMHSQMIKGSPPVRFKDQNYDELKIENFQLKETNLKQKKELGGLRELTKHLKMTLEVRESELEVYRKKCKKLKNRLTQVTEAASCIKQRKDKILEKKKALLSRGRKDYKKLIFVQKKSICVELDLRSQLKAVRGKVSDLNIRLSQIGNLNDLAEERTKTLKRTNTKLESRLELTESQIKKFSSEAKKHKNRKKELIQKNKIKKAEIKELKTKLVEAEANAQEKETILTDSQSRLTKLESKLEELKKENLESKSQILNLTELVPRSLQERIARKFYPGTKVDSLTLTPVPNFLLKGTTPVSVAIRDGSSYLVSKFGVGLIEIFNDETVFSSKVAGSKSKADN